jgi:L-rhamnonate dehydratase
VSELVKICTLASAFGTHVVPHGHSIHAALHVIAAQSPAVCPLAEFLLRAQQSKQHFFAEPMWPDGGSIALPTAPGLGFGIKAEAIDRREEVGAVTAGR